MNPFFYGVKKTVRLGSHYIRVRTLTKLSFLWANRAPKETLTNKLRRYDMDDEWNQDDWDGCDYAEWLMPDHE